MLRANAIGVGQFLGFCVGSADVPASALIFSQRQIGEQWITFKNSFFSHTRSGPDFFRGESAVMDAKAKSRLRRSDALRAGLQKSNCRGMSRVRVSIEAICCR